MADKTDLYYIRKIKLGEIDVFVHLVRKYNIKVFTTVNKIIRRRDEAEDITQEIYLKVFENIHRFREDSEFSTWLYRIAYNVTVSHLRKQKSNILAFEDNYDNIKDEPVSDEIDRIDKEIQLTYLDKILQKMPSEDALLITMFYLNSLSISEIESITGLSRANVKVKLHRIRKYMNTEMNKLIAQ